MTVTGRGLWPLAMAMYMLAGTGIAQAAPPAERFVPAGDLADAPDGFLAMCRRDHDLCTAGLSNAEGASRAIFRPIVNHKAAPVSSGDATAALCAQMGTAAPAVAAPMAMDAALSTGLATMAAASVCAAEARPGSGAAMPIVGAPVIVAAARPPVIGAPIDLSGGMGTAALGKRMRDADREEAAEGAVTADIATPAGEAMLVRAINREVNRQVVPVPDIASHGVEEEWDRPGRVGRPAGDCEDYAIEKRMRLVEAGFPADRLFYAVVYRANFGLHTVLVARLSDGDYVLDSANPQVLPWTRVRYSWLRVQSTTNPYLWRRVGARS